MKSISFNRFKKKSLILIYRVYPKDEDIIENICKIKFKKLAICISKTNLLLDFEDKTLNGDTRKI